MEISLKELYNEMKYVDKDSFEWQVLAIIYKINGGKRDVNKIEEKNDFIKHYMKACRYISPLRIEVMVKGNASALYNKFYRSANKVEKMKDIKLENIDSIEEMVDELTKITKEKFIEQGISKEEAERRLNYITVKSQWMSKI